MTVWVMEAMLWMQKLKVLWIGSLQEETAGEMRLFFKIRHLEERERETERFFGYPRCMGSQGSRFQCNLMEKAFV